MRVLLLLIFSFTLFAEKLPVMLKIKTDLELNESITDVLRAGVEDALTTSGYSLISKEQQEEAIKEQAKQQASDCYDESCLVTTGRMMAARMLFILKINKLGEEYIFKGEVIDLESGALKKTFTKIYKGSLDSASKLLEFSKKLTYKIIEGTENVKVIPQYHILRVDTLPTGSEVVINGRKVGNTPLKLKLTSGKYEIEMFHDNFKRIKIEKYLTKDLEIFKTLELDCNEKNTEFCTSYAFDLLKKKKKAAVKLLKKICSLNGAKACKKLNDIKEEERLSRESEERAWKKLREERRAEERKKGNNTLSVIVVAGEKLMLGVELIHSRFEYWQFTLGDLYMSPDAKNFGVNILAIGLRIFHDSSYKHAVNLNFWLGAEYSEDYEAVFPVELSYRYSHNKKVYFEVGITGFLLSHEKIEGTSDYDETKTLKKYNLFLRAGFF